MNIDYIENDKITPEEMQSLEESVGFDPHRTIDRNRAALKGSIFIASARYNGQLVGLIRLIGDGGYILHLAGLSVHPDFQNKGIGQKLLHMALDFAKKTKVGTGNNLVEFTLFANVGADTFYEKVGFTLIPNGMELIDTKSRRQYELDFQKKWYQKKKR